MKNTGMIVAVLAGLGLWAWSKSKAQAAIPKPPAAKGILVVGKEAALAGKTPSEIAALTPPTALDLSIAKAAALGTSPENDPYIHPTEATKMQVWAMYEANPNAVIYGYFSGLGMGLVPDWAAHWLKTQGFTIPEPPLSEAIKDILAQIAAGTLVTGGD